MKEWESQTKAEEELQRYEELKIETENLRKKYSYFQLTILEAY